MTFGADPADEKNVSPISSAATSGRTRAWARFDARKTDENRRAPIGPRIVRVCVHDRARQNRDPTKSPEKTARKNLRPRDFVVSPSARFCTQTRKKDLRPDAVFGNEFRCTGIARRDARHGDRLPPLPRRDGFEQLGGQIPLRREPLRREHGRVGHRNGGCHLSAPVTDFERSKQFYGHVLGFELRSSGPRHLIFHRDGIELGAFLCDAPADAGDYGNRARSVLVFEVESVERAMNDLKAKGVQFLHEEPNENPWGRYAAFVDPFGIVHEVFERSSVAPT